MAKFDYKKWITENKYGKPLYEQGTADFQENAPADYIAEQTGSGTGSGNPSTGSGNPSTGSAAPTCYYCVTGSQGNLIGTSPAQQGNWSSGQYFNGYSWNSQGDCLSSNYYPGDLTQSTVQAACQTTPTGSGTGSATGSNCPGPTGLSTTNITGTSATLNWS